MKGAILAVVAPASLLEFALWSVFVGSMAGLAIGFGG
jgi:hypothetical protein